MWFINKKKIGLVTDVENMSNSEFKSRLTIIIYDANKTLRTISSVYSNDTFSIGDCVKYDEEKGIAFNNEKGSGICIDELNTLINLYRKQRISEVGTIAEDDKMLVSDAKFKAIMEQEISAKSFEGLTTSQQYDLNVLIGEYESKSK